MSAELSDLEIVRGLRAGDRDAWDALYEQYRQRVWQYVARLVGSDEDRVADVFQETMLAAARSGRRLGEETKLWAWLSRISHNQAAFYWRKRYRQRTTSLDRETVDTRSLNTGSLNTGSLHADLEGDPAQAFARAEQVESVRRLLAEMDAEHVALLTAKYIDDMTVPQIVASFGGTKGSVRGKLERARDDFRERFSRAQHYAATPAARDSSSSEGDS